MGLVESAIIGIYAIASTWFNIHQSGVIGGLEVEIEQLEPIARECRIKGGADHERAIHAANDRSNAEQAATDATERARAVTAGVVENHSVPCAATPVGRLGSVVHEQRARLFEELHGVQASP